MCIRDRDWLRVELAEFLDPASEMPLTIRFAAQDPPGFAFGETAAGPGWNPWASAGPLPGGQPWFPMVEPGGSCATLDAKLRAGHGVQVLLAGAAVRALPSPGGTGQDDAEFSFRSSEPLALARLVLAAGRLRPVGGRGVAARVWVPRDRLGAHGERLAAALGQRESALGARLGMHGDGSRQAAGSALEPAPVVLVELPNEAGQRLDGVGVLCLGPALAQRLASGGMTAAMDPLAVGLARQHIAGRHVVARPSEAWLFEGLAGYLAMAAMEPINPRELAWHGLVHGSAWSNALAREQQALYVSPARAGFVSTELRTGAALIEGLAREFGEPSLQAAIGQALAARRGASMGIADLARAFAATDGRDLEPRLLALSRSAGPPAWPAPAEGAPSLEAPLAILQALAELPRDKPVPPAYLQWAALSPERGVRAAIYARLDARDPSQAQLLLRALAKDPEPGVRAAALGPLLDVKAGKRPYLAELQAAMMHEEDLAVRAAFGEIRRPESR